ncbi:MAG: glycine--tRNA ligase subunit beta, partial [Gammaproteobacteria bacterium]
DAAFFWDQDRKLRLQDRLSTLKGIVFEKRLGSIRDKSDRVVNLARTLASEFEADADLCTRAALLSRCDLVTKMVGEFPALQGLMGGYYATHDREPPEVAGALREFYMPRFAGDSIPTTPAGRCIAYADKLDTLIGIFSVGSIPTGDKDPFALRRAALGCIRIAIESDSRIGLRESIAFACEGYTNVVDTENTADNVLKFIIERIRGYFAEQKFAGSVIEAVLAVSSNSPSDIQQRIAAVAAFQRLPESKALASANKRIANILRKNSIEGVSSINAALLQDPVEKALAQSIESVSTAAASFLQRADHAAYLKVLTELHDPVNLFFDEVMVMCDDLEIRENRIALLNKIRSLFTSVADIARLND